MKKIIFFSLLLVFVSLLAAGQQFGVMLGGGLSKKTGTSDISNDITDPLFTLNGYLFTNIGIGKKHSAVLLPSLGYTSKGIVYHDLYLMDILGNIFTKSDYKSRISYLQLDIPLCYQFSFSNKGKMFVGGGPYMAYALSGKAGYFNNSASDVNDDRFSGTTSIDFKNENLSRFDAGLVLQAYAIFSGRYCVGLKWDIGLANLYKKKVFGDTHNRMFGLNVGYIFNKK